MSGVLNVCTANRIRSVMAEAAMRSLLPGVTTSSAGILARPGDGVIPDADREIGRRGWAPMTHHVARRLTPDLVRSADVVLTASRNQRDQTLFEYPRLLGRCFTWREFAWLASDVRPEELTGRTSLERLLEVSALASARRGLRTPPPPDAFDVRDPIDGPPEAYRLAADEIGEAIERLVPLLATTDLDSTAPIPGLGHAGASQRPAPRRPAGAPISRAS